MAFQRQHVVRTLVGAAALVFVAGRSLGGTVVIIEGTDATRNATVRRIADAAQANYTAQGYTINRLSNMNGAVTRAAAVAAINANGVNAVFFMGHGTTNAGMFTPGLVLDSANNTALTPADLAGNYGGIRYVELQACGQNLAGWQNLFPNAQLDAWRQSVTTDQIVNDVRRRHTGPQSREEPGRPRRRRGEPDGDGRTLRESDPPVRGAPVAGDHGRVSGRLDHARVHAHQQRAGPVRLRACQHVPTSRPPTARASGRSAG